MPGPTIFDGDCDLGGVSRTCDPDLRVGRSCTSRRSPPGCTSPHRSRPDRTRSVAVRLQRQCAIGDAESTGFSRSTTSSMTVSRSCQLCAARTAAFDARQIKQVTDQVVQVRRLFFDRLGEILTFLLGPGHVLLAQAAGGRHDRRQRRAQVVRHGVQQRPTQLIRAAQNLGLGRLLAEPCAFIEPANLRRRGGDQAIVSGVKGSDGLTSSRAPTRRRRPVPVPDGCRCDWHWIGSDAPTRTQRPGMA